MLALLVSSTIAAALVPPPESEDSATSSSSTSPRTSTVPTGGELVEVTIKADAKKPKDVQVPLGDQVALVVRSSRAGQIELTGLGQLDDVAPLSPARFDLLASREGRFDIRLVEPDRRLGTIEVVAPES